MNGFILSLKKNIKGITIILISAFLVSIGQLFWKLSGGEINMKLIIGFLCYGIGAILMIIAFRFGSFSVIHPMMSLGYIFATILGYIVLKEPINFLKVAGIITIFLGVTFIGMGDD